MKALNIEAAEKLVKKYRSITVKHIMDYFCFPNPDSEFSSDFMDGELIASKLTGFSHPSTCPLCKALPKLCRGCVYNVLKSDKYNEGLFYCTKLEASKTFD